MPIYVEPELAEVGSIVHITKEDIKEEIGFWQFVLAGFFVGPMHKLAMIRGFIEKKWGRVSHPQLLCYPLGWYNFRFDSKEDMELNVKGGLWQVGNRGLILKP